MVNYIKKLIMERSPTYFYWEDILTDFVSYYRAIFRTSNGKLYIFRCFFSDITVAKDPLSLFVINDSSFKSMDLEIIGTLEEINNFVEGKNLYKLTRKNLRNLQQTLENYLQSCILKLFEVLPELSVEVKIFWRPTVLLSCYIMKDCKLVGIVLLLQNNIIPLNGNFYYLNKVISVLQSFWKTNFSSNQLIGRDIYGT